MRQLITASFVASVASTVRARRAAADAQRARSLAASALMVAQARWDAAVARGEDPTMCERCDGGTGGRGGLCLDCSSQSLRAYCRACQAVPQGMCDACYQAGGYFRDD